MFALIFGIIVVSINVSIPFWFTSSGDNTPDEYGLTDTIIVPYTKFCYSLEIESKDSVQSEWHSGSNATLYLLNSPPTLSGHETFTHMHTISFTKAVYAQVWSIILHPGSAFEFDACYVEKKGTKAIRGVVFYLIQGDENYNNWVDDPDDSYSVQHIEQNDHCTHVNYRVYTDDMYYLAFFNTMENESSMNVRLKFNRTKYEHSHDTVVNNCTIAVDSHSSCSVYLPMTPSYTALLVLDTSPPVDWDDGVTIAIKCQPRGWLYAVIVTGVVVLLLTITAVVMVTCLCAYLKRRGRRKSYTQIGNSEPSVSINSYGRPPTWWYRPRTASRGSFLVKK